MLGGRGMEVVHDEEMLERVCGRCRGGHSGSAHPHRQVPGKRHRSRSGRHRRRHRCLCARGDGAHRAGRHPLRGFGLRDSAHQHSGQTSGYHLRIYSQDRRGTQRGRAHEYAVCHCQRYGLRPRSQSPSFTHGAAGLQGLQHPHGASGNPAHAGKEARRTGPQTQAHSPFRSEGSGLSLQHVP